LDRRSLAVPQKKRISYGINNVRNQILIPGRERNFQDSRDKLSLQFFALYCSELEATKNSEQDLTRLDERLKFFRAAPKAEIELRVAEQAGKSETHIAQLRRNWKAAYQQVTDKQHSASNKPSPKTITDDQKALGIEYRSILDVKPEIAVSAGIGAGFDYKVFLQDSKLYMSVKGNMVVGVGGGGSIAAELDGKQIWELVKFIRWSLEQSDFRFMDWVDEGVFEQITLLMKALVVTKADFNELG
jgi:hypothetical protein